MATITQMPSGRYRVQIRVKDHPYKSGTFDGKLQANEWARQQEAICRASTPSNATELRGYTLLDVGTLYAGSVLNGRSSFSSTLKQLDFLSRWFPQPFLKITKREINAFRLERLLQVKPVTCRDNIMLISRIFRWAERELLFDDILPDGLPNPCKGIPLPQGSKPRNKVVTSDELKLLLSALPPRMRPVIELAFETAMRRGEILKLRAMDFYPQERLASVIDGKTGDRSVPLTTRASQILQEAVDRVSHRNARLFPIAPHSVSTAVRRARRKVGLSEDVRLHQLRHTRISIVARKGFNNAQIMVVSGHKDVRSVQRYTHLNAADVVKLLD